jgi:hypothetical protein
MLCSRLAVAKRCHDMPDIGMSSPRVVLHEHEHQHEHERWMSVQRVLSYDTAKAVESRIDCGLHSVSDKHASVWTRRCHQSPGLARVSLAELRPSSRFDQALSLSITPPLSTGIVQLSPRRRLPD